MKKHTVDVLDAAAALERKMRWLDFKNEQERLLQYDPNAEWNVGDYRFDGATHGSRQGIFATEYGVSEFHNYTDGEYSTEVNTWGLRFCEDCEVYTDLDEYGCWFCETTYEPIGVTDKSTKKLDMAAYSFADTAAVREMMIESSEIIAEHYRAMTPVLRNLNAQIQVYMTVSFNGMQIAFGEVARFPFYVDDWAVIEPYQPETDANAWYMANQFDPEGLFETYMPPTTYVSWDESNAFRARIEWPEGVSLEPEIPLPGPVFETPNWETLQHQNSLGPRRGLWQDERRRNR